MNIFKVKYIEANSKLFGWLAFVCFVLIGYLLGDLFLPQRLPVGVILLGGVDGALYGLTALGLVLIYRSQRIINFAQAEVGAMSVSVAVVLVSIEHVEYFIALVAGLAAALITGAIVHFVIEARFKNSSRMVLTVATLGIAQLIGAAEVGFPTLVQGSVSISTFNTPFNFSFTISDIKFTGDSVVALCIAFICLFGLYIFLEKTLSGIAIRASADSRDRARLLGIPVKRLSLITWMFAAGLSALGAMAAAPTSMGNPPDFTAIAGPVVLLPPLAAAIIGRMENLIHTVIAAVLIGIFQQATFWSYPRSSVVDVGLFLAIIVTLIIKPPKRARSEMGSVAQGALTLAQGARSIPRAISEIKSVKVLRVFFPALVFLAALIVPPLLGQHVTLVLSYMTIFGIVTVSLVLLSGWGGQISLGQGGFAGVGAAISGMLIVHANMDVFLSLLIAALSGGLIALLIGVPSLRIPGLFLSVATLSFAVPVDTFLLNATHFSFINPSRVPPPLLFGRFNLGNLDNFYVFSFVILILTMVAVSGFRRSRSGRVLIGTRDNESAVSSYGVKPILIKLNAFFISGSICGIAGALLIILQEGSGFQGFDPELSFTVFIAAVVGGLGSLSGAIFGAVFIGLTQYYLSGILQLAVQGVFLIIFLTFFPEGIGGMVSSLRDRILFYVANQKDIEVATLRETAHFDDTKEVADLDLDVGDSILDVKDLNAYYGQVQVLFGVTTTIERGSLVAVLGTNGAGKSTLLKVIGGLINPKPGSIVFDGKDITLTDVEDRVRGGLVTTPGGRAIFQSLTVGENLRVSTWIYKKDRNFIADQTNFIFDLFPVLKERIDVKAELLSGGEQQMLTIAQSLLCKPKMLMIDELSLGLAPLVVGELLNVLRELNSKGVTVLLVEQSLNVAMHVSEKSLFLERGQVRYLGLTSELKDRNDLARSIFFSSGTAIHETSPVIEVTKIDKIYDNDIALEAKQILKTFGGVAALSDLNLVVMKNSIHGIIGANGAGKTTFFDICSGFTKPNEGVIILNGVDITKYPSDRRANFGLGRLFQHATLFPSLTVEETLAIAHDRFIWPKESFSALFHLPATKKIEKEVLDSVSEILERLHLERYRESYISELSTGTRRVVEIGCALSFKPKVLLLDEPSSGLAQREAESLGGVLVDLKNSTDATLIIIEHDVPIVASISDTLTCFHLGMTIASGTPKNVLQDPRVVSSYLGADYEAIRRSDFIKTL